MSETPTDVRYSPDHLWVRPSADRRVARLGITDHAQNELGDITDVALPTVGQTVRRGEACGEVESTKSVSELISPLDGTIHAANETLATTPELVNSDPYGDGWIFDHPF